MNDMPDVIKVRDTELHDDLGGAGQRIYTTSGRGYSKTSYTRTDIHNKLKEENEQLKRAMKDGGQIAEDATATIYNLHEENERLQERIAELEGALEEVSDGTSDPWIVPIAEKALKVTNCNSKPVDIEKIRSRAKFYVESKANHNSLTKRWIERDNSVVDAVIDHLAEKYDFIPKGASE